MAEIHCPLREAAEISPHETALVYGDAEYLYSELDQVVSVTANRLRAAGCKPGAHIATFLPQDDRHIILLLALIRAGCVACPLNTRWPRSRVETALSIIDATCVIAHGKDARVGPSARLDPDALLLPGGDPLPWTGRMSLDQHATMVFTSGTSGLPRAAVHTFGNHYYSARGANANIRMQTKDRWLLGLPLFHVGGLAVMFRCLLGGSTIVLPSANLPLHDALASTQATHVSMVATQLLRWLTGEGVTSPSSLKAVVLGGGPVPSDLVYKARKMRIPVYPSYGLTEMSSQVTTVKPDSPPARHASSGALLRHRELRVSAEGEIQVKGQTLFAGFYQQGSLQDPRDDQGWYATGDVGFMTPDGYLVVTGRKDDQFISGGENIQPGEIEHVLLGLPGIRRAVVVPVPDSEFGMRPVAIIEPFDDGDAMKLTLRDRLPGYMIPEAFLPFPDPFDDNAKPDRKALAEYARSIVSRDRA